MSRADINKSPLSPVLHYPSISSHHLLRFIPSRSMQSTAHGRVVLIYSSSSYVRMPSFSNLRLASSKAQVWMLQLLAFVLSVQTPANASQHRHQARHLRCIRAQSIDGTGGRESTKDADIPRNLPALTLGLLSWGDAPEPSGRRVVGWAVSAAHLGARQSRYALLGERGERQRAGQPDGHREGVVRSEPFGSGSGVVLPRTGKRAAAWGAAFRQRRARYLERVRCRWGS